MPERLRIGEFARLSGISVTALRYYDEIGLLQPAEVVSGSSYRLYDSEQLVDACLIRELRRLEMPLDQVAAALADPERRPAIVDAQRRTLFERVAALLDLVVDATGEDTAPVAYHVREEELAPIEAVVHRRRAASVAVDEVIATVLGSAAGEGIVVIGAPDEDDLVDLAVGIPADSDVGADELSRRETLLGWPALVATFTGDPEDARRAVVALRDRAVGSEYSLGAEIVQFISRSSRSSEIAWRIPSLSIDPPSAETFFRPAP